MLTTISVPPDVSTIAAHALEAIDHIELDTQTLPHRDLDLTSRSRTSVFPWRGQFSPDLVTRLLSVCARQGELVLDPFVGSGTTLLEAARSDLRAFGAEINPAAIMMASTAKFANLNIVDRKQILACFSKIINHVWPVKLLLAPRESPSAANSEMYFRLHELLELAAPDQFNLILAQNLILRLNDDLYHHRHIADDKIWSQVQVLSRIILEIPFTRAECEVFHSDARNLPVPNGVVDVILTSPPYINVFNYHQNYRAATELLGWDLLRIAKSEFGANRKHRSNRFLTVVQYGLDMATTLMEFKRVLKPNGTAVLIIGRESKVRGTRFENSRLVAALATHGAGFKLSKRQERKFKTKFGKLIYEDILHLNPTVDANIRLDDFARSIGEAVLIDAAARSEAEVRTDIESAIAGVGMVEQSPLFKSPVDERTRDS